MQAISHYDVVLTSNFWCVADVDRRAVAGRPAGALCRFRFLDLMRRPPECPVTLRDSEYAHIATYQPAACSRGPVTRARTFQSAD